MKSIQQKWRRFKLPFFSLFSILLFVVDKYDLWLTCQHIYSLTGYILVVTLFIVFVQRRYREPVQISSVPNLQLVTQKSNAEKFHLADILQHEFEYVKETASQAMNDRHTMVNYFLLSAGVVLAGSGVMVSEEGGARFSYRYEVLVALSLVFNSVGWVYFMQMVRLRQAWCESARAMNHIKSVFVENCEFFVGQAKNVFKWKINTIPAAGKKMTVFYFSALLISILSSTAIALSGVILFNIDLLRKADQLHQPLEIPNLSLWISFGLGLYHLFFQMSMYTALLEE